MRAVWRLALSSSLSSSVVCLVAGCGFNVAGAPDAAVVDGASHDAVVPPGDASASDASPDAASPVDANPLPCFGPPGAFQVCLTPNNAPLILSSLIDTTACEGGEKVTMSGRTVCVVSGSTVTVSGNVRGGGVYPLVILATGSLTVAANATVDVSSSREQNAREGAGAEAETACQAGGAPTNNPEGASGGVGGSFRTRGGPGGKSTRTNATSEEPAAAVMPTFLRAGCPGRAGGNGSGSGGEAGKGGGAVYLLSAGALFLHGQINASGGGAGGAQAGNGGGGGGGSGGMIVLYGAPLDVTSTAQLWANGGAGGGGAASNSAGSDGSQSSNPMSPANPGTGASGPMSGPMSGNGGNGGAGAVNLQDGQAGHEANRGGGGGGGGVGVILNLSSSSTLDGTFSPPLM